MNGQHYASLNIPNLFDLNTKIVLRTTVLLIVAGTALIAFFEWDNTFTGMRIHEKLTQAFFNAVSPRTAGFISVNLSSMCIQSIFVYTILMWIGGASQSTAGGVKVNAIAVAFLNIRAIIHGTTRVEFAGRELSSDSIRRANAAVFVSLMVLGVFIFLVTLTDPDLPLKAIVFECVSAFGTVGSSLGITSELQYNSKVLIILLMFTGRVGLVTMAQGLLKQYKNQNYKLPQDNITIS
jgi:Trk-type K+ transport system membrane component